MPDEFESGFQQFTSSPNDDAASLAHQLAYAVIVLGPLGQVEPLANAFGLGVKATDAIQAQALGEHGQLTQLGEVFHEVANPSFGGLGVGHAVGPERGTMLAELGRFGGFVPMGHAHALREPTKQVVMHRATRLQFGHPGVTAGEAATLAPVAIGLQGLGYVLGLPIGHPDIGEGHKMALVSPETVLRDAVEVTGGPH